VGAPVGTADSKDEDRVGDGEGRALGEDDGSTVGMLVGTKDGDRDSENTVLGTDDESSVGMLVGTEEGVEDGLPLPIIVPASDGVVVGAED